MFEYPADEARQRRAVIRDGKHLRHGEEVRDGNGDLPLEILPLQRLEDARAQPARREHVHMLEPLVLLSGNTVSNVGMAAPHHAGESVVQKMLDDQAVRRIDDAAKHHGGGAGNDAGLGKSIALVCHAPGVLHRVTNPDGTPFVKGRYVTGFTNSEEAAVGLADVVPFLLEDEFISLGAVFSKVKDWGVHVVVDGGLITGQNPASSGEAAEALVAALTQTKIRGA